MKSGIVICCLSVSMAASSILTASAQNPRAERTTIGARVGLNFMRPDVGRPGNYDFKTNGVWLAGQLNEMGVQWTRMAFSWVLVQPSKDEFDWSAYDRIVDACTAEHIQILATLGGHFDRPPVPAWAGRTLADVVANHPEYLERFIQAWVSRYKDRIHYWEILNEPSGQHFDLTLSTYVEKILKPSYRIIKAADPQAKVLPCAYGNLPDARSRREDPRGSEAFWDLARGYYDIGNFHEYADWNIFRTEPVADMEERDLRNFKALMAKHGEGEKPFWVTEIGWWGTGSLSNKYDVYRQDPETGMTFKPVYTGKEIIENPVVLREDALRAEWMKDLITRVASIPGCEKLFLWASMDEFEGGFDPHTEYGEHAAEADLWGFIAGDKTWRKSAFTLQQILKQ
ncbi:MAG: family 1 glycosylhydrolase [Terracidiphilus sp.]